MAVAQGQAHLPFLLRVSPLLFCHHMHLCVRHRQLAVRKHFALLYRLPLQVRHSAWGRGCFAA